MSFIFRDVSDWKLLQRDSLLRTCAVIDQKPCRESLRKSKTHLVMYTTNLIVLLDKCNYLSFVKSVRTHIGPNKTIKTNYLKSVSYIFFYYPTSIGILYCINDGCIKCNRYSQFCTSSESRLCALDAILNMNKNLCSKCMWQLYLINVI